MLNHEPVIKESDPPTLHWASVVVYERDGWLQIVFMKEKNKVLIC